MTLARKDVARFLGGRNFKGLYTKNPLAATPGYHGFDKNYGYLTSYKVRPKHREGPTTNWRGVFSKENAKPSRTPFPQNQFTQTNKALSGELRQNIVTDHNAGETAQRLSFKYKISVPRIDAVIRLEAVKQQMTQEDKITKEMRTMAKHIGGLFQQIETGNDGAPRQKVDDLTEIPLPKETRTQRFRTIAESEPFGPIDAATVLGIEPAAKTLERLTQVADSEPDVTEAAAHRKREAFYAPLLEGERARYKFTDARVGHVGFRYGAARDDRKHGRRVHFEPNGEVTYPLPEHSDD